MTILIATATALTAVLSGTTPPSAAHTVANQTYAVVSTTLYITPQGANDNPYNGYRIFLSAPRQADSGNRGECRNPGREENINGRAFASHSANGTYIGDTQYPQSRLRNIHARGYQVAVSPNTRDNGHQSNITLSRNRGSHIHIPTHSNALQGCGNATADYLLTMYNHAIDHELANRVGTLTTHVPGGYNQWQHSGLAELNRNAPHGDAYLELQFHDNPARQSWMNLTGARGVAHRMGAIIDNHLGAPR